VSVTVPFPQSIYRFALSSTHGPAALVEDIREDSVGDVDGVDASAGPPDVMVMVTSARAIVTKIAQQKFIRSA
jgi:hypothetical protein